MKRNTRAEKAKETLAIIEQGYYEHTQGKVDLEDGLTYALDHCRLYHPDAFDVVLEDASQKCGQLDFDTVITVGNTTVLEAAAALAQTGDRVGCLNFASAKNPGGGFLGGAQAQEESLALSSALYPTLMKHFEMYEYNRNRSTYLYSNYMIYSPEVAVFRNDDGELLADPYSLSFVTSPAVNIGAMKNSRLEELVQAEAVMLDRMDKVLALFVHHGIEHLLLGAWGCGVFQNDPADIARYFASFLLEGGKYSRCFRSVTFAVLDRSKEGRNISVFEDILKSKQLKSVER